MKTTVPHQFTAHWNTSTGALERVYIQYADVYRDENGAIVSITAGDHLAVTSENVGAFLDKINAGTTEKVAALEAEIKALKNPAVENENSV